MKRKRLRKNSLYFGDRVSVLHDPDISTVWVQWRKGKPFNHDRDFTDRDKVTRRHKAERYARKLAKEVASREKKWAAFEASRKRNPSSSSSVVKEVIAFWRNFAKQQGLSSKTLNAGIKEIRSDVDYWAGNSMWRLADAVGLEFKGIKPKSNPNGIPSNMLGPVIGNRVLAVEYEGGDGKNPKSSWRHDFTKAGAQVIGLKDGSVLLKRGKKPLWKEFD